ISLFLSTNTTPHATHPMSPTGLRRTTPDIFMRIWAHPRFSSGKGLTLVPTNICLPQTVASAASSRYAGATIPEKVHGEIKPISHGPLPSNASKHVQAGQIPLRAKIFHAVYVVPGPLYLFV
ncbi:hypothetical protein C8R44DRAFT_775675, partial [Mycena epipterygia]